MSAIERFTKVLDLQQRLNDCRKSDKIGFVPTMGALHEGHLSLVDRALDECETVVVSIFVNPKQFNNPTDLEKYPRTIEKDIALLGSRNLIVFHPTFEEVYPADFKEVKVELGEIANLMEGKFRPGHFDGVVTVVSRLFDIVQADRAYFGSKDYQQLAIIQQLVRIQERAIEIVPCEIHRDGNGLALSSRNMLLSTEGIEKASAINKLLLEANNLKADHSPEEARETLYKLFEVEGYQPEYLEICDPITLRSLRSEWVKGARIFVACFVEKVRLIDNIELL